MADGEDTPGGETPLRVLIVEDTENDVLLMLRELRAMGYEPRHAVVDSAAGLRAALDAGPWDVILSDFAMPQFTGLDALAILRESGLDIPFLLVSGTVDEDVAVAAMKAGAHDYLLKASLQRLGAAVAREIREAGNRRARAESELRYRSLFENMTEGVAVCRMVYEGDRPVDFAFVDVNGAFEAQTGLRGVVGWKVTEVIPGIGESDRGLFELYGRVCATGQPERTEIHVAALREWFDVSTYRLMKHHFVAVFNVITERRLAETKLRESRDFLDKIIDALADPVFVKDRRHRMVLVNDALCRLTGRPREELLGRTDHDLFPGEQADVFWKHDDLVLETGGEDVNEELLTQASGAVRTLITKKTRYVSPSGEPYLVGVIRDVTERKGAEKELTKFVLGLERSTDAIFLTAPDGRIEYVNPAFEQTYGFTKEEALGQTPRLLKSGRQAPSSYRELWSTLLAGHVFRGELVNRTKDGRLLDVDTSVNPILDDRGVLLGFLAIHRDVTERKRTSDALRASEERFRTLVEAMDDVVVTVDRDARITSAANTLLQRVGMSSSDVIGKTISELLGPPHDEAFAQVLGGRTAAYEWSFEPGGERRQMHTVASPLRDAAGRVVGAVGVSRDVTEHRKLQDQLLLSERMTSMGTLAAGVAHEINNPLAAVMANLDFAFTELSRDEPGVRPTMAVAEALEALREAREGAERVRQIVRDMKVFSRPDETRRELLDLPRIIESSLRMVSNELRHRANVVKDYQVTPRVLSNDARLGQVFVNLLINAAQSIPDGQADRNTITVRTRASSSNQAVVEIQDTGVGTPPGVIEKIFDPFFTTKPVGVGTGLGLAICQRIVTELGGTIAIDSTMGRGTCARVVLPAAPEDEQVEATRPSSAQSSTRRASILVIDDDPGLLKALARMVGERHDVTAVTRGREALDRIAAGEHFDLVVSDLMMPEMSGVDVYDALRRVAPEHARRMIFLTGGAFTQRTREFLDEVDNLRLDKPFEASALLALIASSLDRRD